MHKCTQCVNFNPSVIKNPCDYTVYVGQQSGQKTDVGLNVLFGHFTRNYKLDVQIIMYCDVQCIL